MSVIYRLKQPGMESAQELNANQIMAAANQALAGTDKSIIAITPDGLNAQMSMGGKQYTVPISKIIQSTGAQIESVLPPKEQTTFDAVNPAWRLAISNLEDDAQRKAYIEAKVRQQNPQAEVLGSGRDWYAYDPAQAKWIAVTNSPDWDLADLAEGANTGLGVIGGTVGGLLGAAGGTAVAPGPGSVAGGIAGAAGGTALAGTATRGIVGAFDPEYREQFDLGKAAKQIALESTISGALPALGAAAKVGTKAAGPVIQKIVGSPVSSAAQGIGKVAEGVGTVARGTAIGTSGAGKTVGAIVTPGLSTPNLVGAAAVAPKMSVQGANWVAKKLGGGSAEESAEGILRDFSGWLGRRYGQGAAGATKRGINLNPAIKETAEEAAGKTATILGKEAAGRSYGGQIGKGLDVTADAGEKLIRATEEAFGLGMKGIGKAGQALQSGGRALASGGATMSKYEPTVLQQMLAPYVDPNQLRSMDLPVGPDRRWLQAQQMQQRPMYQPVQARGATPGQPVDLKAAYGYEPLNLEI